MTTAFPTNLDTFTNPTAANDLNTPAVLHHVQHANINDAVTALEEKVGIDNSADPNSLDYKIRHIETIAGRTVTAAAFAMTDADGIVNVNCPTACAITGAPGRTPWKKYTIKDASGAAFANNITYTPATGTIDGQASILIQQNYDALTIYSDGTNEFVA